MEDSKRPEKWERVSRAVQLLSSYHWPSEIFGRMHTEFPDATQHDIVTAVAEAREVIRETFDATLGEDALRVRSAIFYLSVIRDETVDIKHRLRAQENLDRLLALHKPRKGLQQGDESLAAFVADQLERIREEAESVNRELTIGSGGE